MNGTRVAVWMIGLALVVVAAFMLFFQTGLDRWVPLSIAGAGLLLIVGVAVMGMSTMRGDSHTEVHEDTHRGHH